MLQLQVENGEPENRISMETENESLVHENDKEHSTGSDKYPAPSTPQLKQGTRLLDDGDCQDQTNCSTEKESEQDGESKSVETTCGDSICVGTLQEDKLQIPEKNLVKEEEESADGFKSERKVSHQLHNIDSLSNKGDDCAEKPIKPSQPHNSCGARSNRKKMKVDWTQELHKKFVHAVEQLGVDHAIPSRILELMKVEGLTRHNVASHLQKYRMHRRHILPKEQERRWPRSRDLIQRNYYQQRPVMAYPSYHSNHTLSTAPIYPVWGQPGSQQAGAQLWGQPGYPAWQPTNNWHWNPHPGMPADHAWGCPVVPPTHHPYTSYPQNAAEFYHAGAVDNSCGMPPVDHHPEEEVIDKVVKEAIGKPWLPLPLGLKPPSTDSVLAELCKQGISTIPPNINSSKPR